RLRVGSFGSHWLSASGGELLKHRFQVFGRVIEHRALFGERFENMQPQAAVALKLRFAKELVGGGLVREAGVGLGVFAHV
nr:hypothetical protein [Tanacetum cinerariifolium]